MRNRTQAIYVVYKTNLSDNGTNEVIRILIAILAGNIAQYIYSVAQLAYRDGTWNWGTPGQVLARLVMAFIAAGVLFTPAWKALQQYTHPLVRWMIAFGLGLGANTAVSGIGVTLSMLIG